VWGTRSTRAAVGRPTGAHACARAGPGESSARRDDLSALGLACRCRRAAPPLPRCHVPVPTAHSSTLVPLPTPPQARLGLAACPNGSEEVHDTNTAAPLCTPQEAGRAAPRTSTHLAPRTHLVLYRAGIGVFFNTRKGCVFHSSRTVARRGRSARRVAWPINHSRRP
jgi:hypothetical protein